MKKQSFILHANAIINAYNDLIMTFTAIEETAAKMDGKIYNRRFHEAVNNLSYVGSVFVRNSENLGISLKNRSYKDGTFTIYIDSYILHDSIKFDDILTNERIDASKTEKAVSDKINAIYKEIAKWEEAAGKFDIYQNILRNALAQFNKVISEVNPIFRPYKLESFDWEHPEYFDIYNRNVK